jgi:hypothetical protein
VQASSRLNFVMSTIGISPGPPFHPQGKLLRIRRQSQRPSHAESCRSQRCYGKCLRRHRKALHISDKRSGQGRDSSRNGASESDLMIRKAGMSITKNEPCTINPYTARCLFSYHSIANIISYFSASGVAAASSSVLSAVSSSAFAESPSVSGVSVASASAESAVGVSVTSGSGVGVGVWIVKL